MTIDKVMKISKYIETELESRYQVYDLTINQAQLLIYFYSFGANEINATNALKELSMDKRSMSLSLKALEAKGYIIRHPNSIDKRQKDIELSLNALEICEDIIASKEEVNALFEVNLTSTQLDEINKIEME
ncbi:MarR family winged helix-turn-helix transcriptional regulator [Mollicutes bacterium LVI A0039]|nr:MarR family winged helix-turn-helix transcriptional regulator [Mollicutes bacterium LVI A0039]